MTARNRLDVYFTKLKFKSAMKELKDLQTFVIDVYCFRFDPPLTDGMDYELYELCEQLDLTYVKSIAVVMLWLMQKKAKFTLTWKYNKELPFRYNMKNRKAPEKLMKSAENVTDWELQHFDLIEYVKKEVPEIWHGTQN